MRVHIRKGSFKMRTTLGIAAALAVNLLFVAGAQAAHRHHGHVSGGAAPQQMIGYGCDENSGRCAQNATHAYVWANGADAKTRAGRRATLATASYDRGQVLGGWPAECQKFPRTRHLWCGCASALEVGLDNEDGWWNLAAHWFGLPRAAPGYNMAAVRYGHVNILKTQVGGTIWMAYDPNNGGVALLHEIDIRHLTIVNPSGYSGAHGRARLASR